MNGRIRYNEVPGYFSGNGGLGSSGRKHWYGRQGSGGQVGGETLSEGASIDELKKAIAVMEAQREVLGDDVVETALAPLREKLAALQAAPAEQRRQVTVLFADMAGFTKLSETMDAERVAELINALWSQLDAVVVAHGGWIDKHIGDALMALWGAETSREDDAEQAIKAALAMQETAAAVAVQRTDERVRFRIGINTGPILLGLVGNRGERTAIGDTVNLASRLQELCPPGGVLVSHGTYRHVRGVFDVEGLEPLAVKGKELPVRTYRVERAKPRAFREPTRGIEGIETRLVGREAELRTLQDAFRQVLSTRQTHLLIINGEAGVGKSRLLYEFDNWIELQPETVFYFKGRSTPAQQRQAFGLVRDLFAFRFDIRENEDLASALEKFRAGMDPLLPKERADIVGQWLGFDFSASPHVQALLGAAEFGGLARAYLDQYFHALAEETPVLVLLEDIHWADDRSLDWLAGLCETQADGRLLIVALARPDFFNRQERWGERPCDFTRLDLRPLSPEAGAELVDEILQKVDFVPGELRELIVGHADGNPFYVEELIKTFIDQGVIERGEPNWRVVTQELQNAHVPPTLTALLQARLDTLSHHEREILQCASVVGRIFWDQPVADLAEDELATVESALQVMKGREFIFQRDPSALAGTEEYIFKHSLLRDVTYETVLLRLRRDYHARIARWLEEHASDRLAEYAGLIAEHYTQAEEFSEAAECWERAGDAAAKVGDSLSASEAFGLALELADTDGDGLLNMGLLLKYGRALEQQGDFEKASGILEALRRVAEEAQDRTMQAEVYTELAWHLARQGDYESASEELAAALVLAREAGGKTLFSALMIAMNYAMNRGDHAGGKALADEALVLARAVQDLSLEAVALNNGSIVALISGDLETAERLLEQSRALAVQVGNRHTEQLAALNLGNVSYEHGDFAKAKRYYQEAYEISREMNYRAKETGSLINLAFAELALGDLPAAWARTRQSLGKALELKLQPSVLYAVLMAGQLRIQEGNLDEGLALLGLVRDHPAADYDAQRDIERFLDELDLEEGPIAAGLAGGAALDLEDVIAGLLSD